MHLPEIIFRKWCHSFEEDVFDKKVYRPEEFDFPPVPDRAGIEFRPDGAFIEWIVDRNGCLLGMKGLWESAPGGLVRVDFDQTPLPARLVEIIRCDANILIIREQAEP